MTVKVIKRGEATFQPYAECDQDECGWDYPQSGAARDMGKLHAQTTGHKVRVVIEQVALWGPA